MCKWDAVIGRCERSFPDTERCTAVGQPHVTPLLPLCTLRFLPRQSLPCGAAGSAGRECPGRRTDQRVVKASMVSGRECDSRRGGSVVPPPPSDEQQLDESSGSDGANRMSDIRSGACSGHRILQSMMDRALSASVGGRTRKVVNYTRLQ